MKFSIIIFSLVSLVTAAPVAEPQESISNCALGKDRIPCGPGATFANCRPGRSLTLLLAAVALSIDAVTVMA